MNYLNAPASDRLRAAANILRGRAQAATPPADPYPGGWSGFGVTDHTNPVRGELYRSALYAGPAEQGYRTGVVTEVKEDCDAACCGCIPMSQADTDYVSTLHPGVGLALANLLAKAANVVQGQGKRTPEGGWTAELPLWAETVLLPVADEILGLPAERALAMQAAVDEVLS